MKLHLLFAAALFVLPAAAFAQGTGAAPDAGGTAPTEGSGAAPGGATSPAQPMAKPPASTMGRHADRSRKPLSAARFARMAAEGGLFEVQSSEIALQKSQDANVKAFAQRMVDDHGKANQKLKELAGAAKLRVPAKLNKRNQARIDQLQEASGTAFDTAYLRAQRQAHRQAIRLFQRYGENGTDPALQNWAKGTLPTLEEHADMLKNINKKL